MSHESTIGHFLDCHLWQEAVRLLDFQIAQKKNNRHYNTLSMYCYERIGEAVEVVGSERYFETKVANNLFYALQAEFASIPYVIPKPSLGLRRYLFLSYPMRALYYAIGLYLLKLAEEFIANYVKTGKKIRAYYGGWLGFDGDDLQINPGNTYYRRYYRAFKAEVRKQTRGETSNKVVVRIDIQNYFETVSIGRLLEHLHEKVKPSIQRSLQFDASAREQIISLFQLIMGGEGGIPQTDNNIVSGYLGYLYLTFADLVFDDLLHGHQALIEDHRIIRYVDDIYLSLTFRDSVARSVREDLVESLTSRVRDELFFRLGLRLNPKTRLFWLNRTDHLAELEASLKKISPQYYIADDNDEDPRNLVENILDELEKLKTSHLDHSPSHDLQEEILKNVYDKRVSQMLEMDHYRERLHNLFVDFDFNLVTIQPHPIIILLLLSRKYEIKQQVPDRPVG